MTLPKSVAVDLQNSKFGAGLKPGFEKGFVYSDGWVDDARLVIGNLRSARDRGAVIHARHRCVSARRAETQRWRAWIAAPRSRAERRLPITRRASSTQPSE